MASPHIFAGEVMNNHIKNIIDDLIRDHRTVIGTEHFCEVQDLDKSEIDSLLKTLWLEDEAFQDHVLDYMHSLIQTRIGWVESRDNYDNGLKPIKDNVTGETSWVNL